METESVKQLLLIEQKTLESLFPMYQKPHVPVMSLQYVKKLWDTKKVVKSSGRWAIKLVC